MRDAAKTKAQLITELIEMRQQVADLEVIVAELNKAEKKLAHLATFPEQNPNLVIETDEAGQVTYLNPVAETRFPDLWTLGSTHPILKDLKSIIAAFQHREQDYIAREIDLGDAVYEQKICYMEDSVIGLRIFAHDITRRKRAERAIQELAKRVVSAQEEERQRVSRELHDEAGQALIALKISLQLLQTDLPMETETLRQNLGEAIALTDLTRHQIGLLARDLRPPALDTVGLNLTLEDFCRDFAKRTHLSIHYQGTELFCSSDEVNICLYRFLQEALTNVAKHAQSNQVHVALECNATFVRLRVSDNGWGFNPKAKMSGSSQATGIGLVGLQERIELLGGRLEIESRMGQGTRVVAHLPLEENL